MILKTDTDLFNALPVCSDPVRCVGDDVVSTDPFGFEEVAEVRAYHESSDEGYAQVDLLALVRLRDGRYAFISAGCDTTGWDCQAAGSIIVALDLDHLLRFGVAEPHRNLLALNPPQDMSVNAAGRYSPSVGLKPSQKTRRKTIRSPKLRKH